MVAVFCVVIGVFLAFFSIMTDKPLGMIVGAIIMGLGIFLGGPSDNDEISQSGYDYINASPVKTQYVKDHNLMADGKITRAEFFSMPKDNTPKEITLGLQK